MVFLFLMRIRIPLVIWSLLLLAGFIRQSSAQESAYAGRVLFRVSPEAVTALRSAFAPVVSGDSHFDPQQCSLANSAAIASLFHLPAALKVTALRPFIPQHNVALERLREQTNPILFTQNKGVVKVVETEATTMLRSSEERISRWFELTFDPTLTAEEVCVLLKKSSLIEVAEPRYKYSLCYTPNDPRFSEQYSLPLIHAPQAWDIVRCDSTMLVADDDIGVDWAHEDLAAAIYINWGEMGVDDQGVPKNMNGIDDDGDGFIDDWHGWDFAGVAGITPDNNPMPLVDHGTHTSGIMGAVGDNKKGVVGVAFGAKILPLKCGDNNGNNVAFGYEGMVYAADMGAKVVNNSWGGSTRSEVGQDIVNYVTAKNCVVVAASGNNSLQQDFYPASYDHVLSVASVNQAAALSGFSNTGIHVDVCAPGESVLNTVLNNMYAPLTGTSMASPTAAGAIALIRQKFPNFTPDQAVEQLRASSDATIITSDRDFFGSGLIDIKKAVSPGDLYSARIVNVSVEDANGDSLLQAGESANIVLSVRNYLSHVSNLKAKFEMVSGGQFVTMPVAPVAFQSANTLDIVQNVSGSFPITISQDAPANAVMIIKATFLCDEAGFGFATDYFTLIINKTYRDLNKNNIIATIDSKGSIGFNDAPDDQQGSGVIWKNPPPSITPEGRSILFMAGLMIAADSAHIVAESPGDFSSEIATEDFAPTSIVHDITPVDRQNAVQELEATYNDSFGSEFSQVGVDVRSKNYAMAAPASDAIIASYSIKHRTLDSGNPPTDHTAIGLFMDWDIGASGSANIATASPYDPEIAVTRRVEPGYPLVGIKLISAKPAGSSLNLYCLNNDGSDGSLDTYSGFDMTDKWLTLTTPRDSAGPNDVTMIYGLKDIPFASLDSLELTFVIAMATDDQALKATIDNAEHEWYTQSSVSQRMAAASLEVYPNPFTEKVTIAYPGTTTGEIAITDMLGRTVFAKKWNGSSETLDLSSLPSGAYHLTLTNEQGSFSKDIIAR